MRRLLCVFPFLVLLAACGGDSNPAAPGPTTIPPQPFSATDLRVGTGAEAVNGKTVSVNYAGWLFSQTGVDNKGTLFDSSAGRGPYNFILGGGGVIPGFDRGVVGMKVGGVRRLVIPPDLAYGTQAQQGIPPNSNLVFDIELLAVQ
jgi:FKBP-type peptidyl-prolyl cis-trans isomerase FkpA